MSSIYIHGMEMPKEGYIDVRLFSDGWAHIPTDEPPYYNRAFEAVELPPHGDLVDRDRLLRSDDIETLCVALRYATPIIPAEEE